MLSLCSCVCDNSEVFESVSVSGTMFLFLHDFQSCPQVYPNYFTVGVCLSESFITALISQMRTSVAVLELSLRATRGHEKFDIEFDFVVCLSNFLAAGLLIIINKSKGKVLIASI